MSIDGPTDGRTKPLIELRVRNLKRVAIEQNSIRKERSGSKQGRAGQGKINIRLIKEEGRLVNRRGSARVNIAMCDGKEK